MFRGSAMVTSWNEAKQEQCQEWAAEVSYDQDNGGLILGSACHCRQMTRQPPEEAAFN
jgi:hypothetical protein